MEFYSAIKNEIMSFLGKWMKLEYFMLSEVSQAPQKVQDCMFSLICGSQAFKLNLYITTHIIYTYICIY
jgi:hypothetical protein